MIYHTTCIARMCERRTVDPQTPYSDAHTPLAALVTNDQTASARVMLRRGATLYQAAVRVRADVRDLDVALWEKLGTRLRAGQF